MPITLWTLRKAALFFCSLVVMGMGWVAFAPLSALAAGGSISGTVTDTAGNPLANIGVHLYVMAGGIWGPTGTYVITDGDGHYTMGDLPPARYRLRFADGGFPLAYATEYYDDALTLAAATDVVVGAGQTVTADAQLSAASAIEGVVTDTAGNPLEGIQASLWIREQTNPSHWVTVGLYATTDSNGVYRLAGIDSGHYRVSFSDTQSPHRYSTEYYNNATLATATEIIVPGQQQVEINIQLAPVGTVTGHITDEAGKPLPNITATVYNDIESDGWERTNYAYTQSSVTDATGVYTITGVDAGPNRLCFADYAYQYADECYADQPDIQKATDLTITSGATTTINAALALRGGISGTVVDASDTPLVGYQVLLYIDPEDDGTWIADATRWAYTDATGVYTFTGLLPEQYRVQFRDPSGQFNAPEFYQDALTVADATDVVVLAGQITPNINGQLEPFSHITGQVTDSQGEPLPNIRITIYPVPTNPHVLPFLMPLTETYTGADGRYNATGLTTGRYFVEFADTFNNLLHTEYYADAGYLMTAAPISVGRVMTVTNLDAQLVPFTALNYPPYATHDQAYVLEGGSTNNIQMPWGPEWTVLINDRDAEFAPITPTLVMSPTHGAVTLTASGLFTYTHDGGESRQDHFTYQLSDGIHTSNVATVTVVITPVFDLPIAVRDAFAVSHGGSTSQLTSGATTLLANDINPEGQPLTATLVTTPTHGTVTLAANGTFTYTHDGSYTISDQFTYQVATVGGHASLPATVTITIDSPAAIELTKTAWIAGVGTGCGGTDALRIPISTTVAYCYTLYNRGIITLTTHALVDDQLGTLLANVPYTLAPGMRYQLVTTATVTAPITNTAIWTATPSAQSPFSLPVTATATARVTFSTTTDDQDADGIVDQREGLADPDQDGLPNFLDPDADGDWVADRQEWGDNPTQPRDSNNDGLADYLDPRFPYNQRLQLPVILR